MKIARRLDLQNPLQARRWLRLLVEDPDCGFRLRPNLNLPTGELGFSVRSNNLGLRGPNQENASNVVLGTSFAMGIAVDNGSNWYDVAGLDSDWLNLGLPVGFQQWSHLIKTHHRGPKSRVVLIYHPNFWIHCMMYERWVESGKGLFTALKWSTNWFRCCLLAVRRVYRRFQSARVGQFFVVEHQGARHPIEVLQSRTDDLGQGAASIERNLQCLERLVEPFQQLVLIRVPVKINMVPSSMLNSEVRVTLMNYERLWDRTRTRLTSLMGTSRLVVREADFMGLEHFHPLDSHWNRHGNEVFGSWIKSIIQ